MANAMWEYVKIMGSFVLIIFMLMLLFEFCQTFIRNRKKQAMEEKMIDKMNNMLEQEIQKKIADELDKIFLGK